VGEHVRVGELDIWTEQVGEGPDVLLIGGAGDTVESWQFQLDGLSDSCRLTAFDNRGAGRTEMPAEPVEAPRVRAIPRRASIELSSAMTPRASVGSPVNMEMSAAKVPAWHWVK
jgi:3-oxoadipate enol-lactonase